ncbi:helix-turn-helix domain-containing protein [Pseudomonas sp. SBT1-2]|uniref:helix-turn-helix domain-containing protein n=1 Tax=Pseudomonas sp. SBT1-2 TaxID=3027852 RepID=UPI00235EA33D|nr:helix-turn-helix transcriptional regulator [Pseudomonas sp. SBT1-2]
MSIGVLSLYPSEQRETSATFMGQWERPERNSRNATSSVSTWLPQLATALVAIIPNGTLELKQADVLPISSTTQHLVNPTRSLWIAVSEEADEVDVVPALIERFRKNFGLSDNSISELFGVSRQTIYNWRTKKTVADAPERIKALANVLSEINAEDVPYLKRSLFYPTNDGLLMQDVLSESNWKNLGPQDVRRVTLELAEKAAQLRLRDRKTISRLEKFNPSQVG